ncbi:MAG: AMP-dependent synthetase/ligase [Acidimicrobiia bacterium]
METITAAFATRVSAQADDVALRAGAGDDAPGLTWSDYADQACGAAAGLRALGLRRGERVALMVRNRPEFHVADMAILLAGGTPVSIYNSSPPDRIAYVVNHAEARIAVVEDVFAGRFAAARAQTPKLEHTVSVGGPTDSDGTFTDLVAADPLDLASAAGEVSPEDLLTIIYTSGTTGDPKGVMLTHRNLCFAVDTYSNVLGRSLQGLRQVSFLPMAHIAERMATHYFHIAEGSVVTTCDDLTALVPTMARVQPEWFFSAPRLWEKLQGAIEAMASADPAAAKGFAEARRLGWEVFLAERDGNGPGPDVAAEWEAARREHVLPLLTKVGLGRVIIALTGAAPIPRHTSEFFLSMGVPLSEVWGMSETAGLGTWSPHHIVPGSVGKPVPGVELRLGPPGDRGAPEGDGEIQVRGPFVFSGYLKDPERTAETLDAEGWLHTGDVGRFDEDGNLSIVDRIKDILVPSSGHNVSPAQLEARLKECPLVGQACVVGDGRAHVAALLVPDPEMARAWATAHGAEGASLADLATHPEFRAEIGTFVDALNQGVPAAERIVAFEVLGEEWKPDSEVLTPTAKLKRRAVNQRYAGVIDTLYR